MASNSGRDEPTTIAADDLETRLFKRLESALFTHLDKQLEVFGLAYNAVEDRLDSVEVKIQKAAPNQDPEHAKALPPSVVAFLKRKTDNITARLDEFQRAIDEMKKKITLLGDVTARHDAFQRKTASTLQQPVDVEESQHTQGPTKKSTAEKSKPLLARVETLSQRTDNMTARLDQSQTSQNQLEEKIIFPSKQLVSTSDVPLRRGKGLQMSLDQMEESFTFLREQHAKADQIYQYQFQLSETLQEIQARLLNLPNIADMSPAAFIETLYHNRFKGSQAAQNSKKLDAWPLAVTKVTPSNNGSSSLQAQIATPKPSGSQGSRKRRRGDIPTPQTLQKPRKRHRDDSSDSTASSESKSSTKSPLEQASPAKSTRSQQSIGERNSTTHRRSSRTPKVPKIMKDFVTWKEVREMHKR